MNDPDQTFILPRQRPAPDDPPGPSGSPGAPEPLETSGERVAFDDDTVIVPERALVAAHEKARLDQWDDEPPARGVMPVEGSPLGRERALGTLAWVMTMIATAAMGLIRLNWPSMRSSELSVWSVTRTPNAVLLPLLREVDPDRVPYYLLLKAWASAFGRSDFALRLPSVIAMALAAALLAKVGTRLGGPRVGFLAGLLVAALPVTSRYAQEAGPQAFVLLGAALATLALVAFLDRPRAWRFAGYAAAIAVTGLGHFTGLLVVLAHGAIVVAMKRRLVPAWLGATVLGALPAAAVMVYFGPPLPDTGAVVPRMPSVTALSQDTFGSILAGGVLIGLGVLAMSVRKPGIVFTVWALVPLAALYPVIRFTTIGAGDMAIVALFGWAGLAAQYLGRALVLRGLAAVLVIAAIGLPDQLAIRRPDGHGEATHELANVLYRQGRPGDAIVYGPADGDGPAGRDIVERYLTPEHRPKDILAKSAARADGHVRTAECPDVDACLGQAGRVWLVRVGVRDSPLTGLEAGKDGALRVRYTPEQTWGLTGLTLTLFTIKPDA